MDSLLGTLAFGCQAVSNARIIDWASFCLKLKKFTMAEHGFSINKSMLKTNMQPSLVVSRRIMKRDMKAI